MDPSATILPPGRPTHRLSSQPAICAMRPLPTHHKFSRPRLPHHRNCPASALGTVGDVFNGHRPDRRCATSGRVTDAPSIIDSPPHRAPFPSLAGQRGPSQARPSHPSPPLRHGTHAPSGPLAPNHSPACRPITHDKAWIAGRRPYPGEPLPRHMRSPVRWQLIVGATPLARDLP